MTDADSSESSKPSPCINGCILKYDERFECGEESNEAFIPSSSSITDLEEIISSHEYECYYPNTNNNAVAANNIQTQSNSTVFDLDSYVLIWQAIIIAIIVPITALLIFKIILIICSKTFNTVCYNENSNTCKCCLYVFSSSYRQRRRNENFNNEIYAPPQAQNNQKNQNKNDQKSKWKQKFKLSRSRNDKSQKKQNEKHDVKDLNVNEIGGGGGDDEHILFNNEYQNVNAIDDDDEPEIVLEEVSVEHNDMNKYVEGQGQNNQIELSFSSQGLRHISYREVV